MLDGPILVLHTGTGFYYTDGETRYTHIGFQDPIELYYGVPSNFTTSP